MPNKRDPARPALSLWLVSLAAVVALVAHFVAALKYSNWTWGFNHYYFLRPAFVGLIIGVGCLLCLPPVWAALPGVRPGPNKPRTKPEKAGPGPNPREPQRKASTRSQAALPARDLGVAAAAAIVFWLVRMPYHFLGDGRLMIRLLDQGKWFHATSPLDRLIHHGVLAAARPLLGWDATLVYAVLSVAAGFAFVLAALRLGAILRHKFFVTAALLTLGTVQLFLGYAESYSLATAAMLAYVVLALEYLAGHRRFPWVGVAFVAGVACHSALLFLAPSFLYLALGRRGKPEEDPRRPHLIPGIAFLAAALLVVAASSLRAKGSLMLLPLLGRGSAQYVLFSWQHLADFLNEQVLVSPLAWIGFAGFVYAFRKDPALRSSHRFRFLLAAAVFPLLVGLVIRPDLGGSRDWDLWSMGSLLYVVAVVAWAAHAMSARREARFAAYALVVVGAIHVFPWAASNHSRELSLDRFQRMLEVNPLWTDVRLASATSELAHFYIEAGADQQALPLLERAVRLDPGTSRYWDALGVAYIGLKRFKDAEAPLRRAVELAPDDRSAYNNLGRAYQGAGRLEEAEAALKKAIDIDSSSGVPYFNLGRVYLAKGDTASALGAYAHATELMPYVGEYWYALATTLEAVGGRRGEAIEAWKRVAALGETDPAQAKARRIALDHIERLENRGTQY